ncbi:enoyl-CoA hydratase [Thauera sp. CAU 1555]|uniref:Enoyl-CoA hydratase n=1 Tax=Thauera sedimentorum TaxID=2767595 RepID=A0ABR9B7K6_9RHOO|nr:enoyl-CoA hydratase [Thauera sedimentorum]MBC9071432.1 enoyl-CoA hydratase [Thauera sedimentorum]MBD8502351.1 enoyl-CoA hydratase [Thauera sedimentorum]
MNSPILVDTRDRVGLITLNRPEVLNALNDTLMDALSAALDRFDIDADIGCVVITGSPRAFAAGADIAQIRQLDYVDAYCGNLITRNWERLKTFRKPVIAAVSGVALGGGCELALMCDVILAAESARFGLPEVKIGALPGAGGTQRLPRAVGKAKAMELCLSGRFMNAEEAERSGLVSRIVPDERLLEEALTLAQSIAAYSLPVLMMIKESINRAFEGPLSEGLLFERRTLHAAFALADQKEGMAAFAEKRPPRFTHR